MAEQHRVGDRRRGTPRRRASRRRREHVRPARELRGARAAPTIAEHGRDEVERGRELGRRRSRVGHLGGVAADHRGDARPAVGAQLLAAAHAGRAGARPTPRARPRRDTDDADRRRERDDCAAPCGPASANSATAPTAMHAEHAAEQPAVAEAHLAPARRDPAEQQPAGGPLQQERRARRASRGCRSPVSRRPRGRAARR